MRYKHWSSVQIFKIGIIIILGLYFLHASQNPEKWIFLDGVNLIFHEAGHVLFMFFGQFLAILGGSLTQLLIPAFIVGYFYYKGQYFSASVVLFWLGQSFVNVSVYAGDAIVQQLPLLGGGHVIHDWHYLLSTIGMLEHTAIVAGMFFWTGVIIYFLAIFLGIYDTTKK